MSILIRGIDIPENCYECFCFQQIKAGIDHPAFNYCVLQNWKQPCTPCTMTVVEAKEGIADYCLFSEVFAPHGRLIDADALIQKLNDEHIPYNSDINFFITNAPTVIEAEGE